MDSTIRKIAEYALATRFESLPQQVIQECKRRLIDSIACAAGAYQEPFSERVCAVAECYQGTPAARVWGSGVETSIEMAAFANGAMLRYLDCSDTYLSKTAGHPSDMLGALVALAEAFEKEGRSLIEAIVVAYEVYCGLCDSLALQEEGFDQSTCAVIGAAAGAGKLLGLQAEELSQALALALAPNLHLYNVRCGALSDWKGCAGPNAARNGVFAALLASKGITGPSSVIEGKGGFFEAVKAFDWLVGGDTSRITGTHLKLHTVCYHGQAAVDAAIIAHQQVAVDDIETVTVETYEAAYRAMGSDPQRWRPQNRETADHSLPYVIAMALQEGKLPLDAYRSERLQSAETQALMDKIRIVSDQEMTDRYPDETRVRIHIVKRDGSTFTHLQKLPKGHAMNPLTDSEAEGKFLQLYPSLGGKGAPEELLKLLWSLDEVTNTKQIVDLLCP